MEIRKAVPNDLELYFSLVNDPLVRENSINQKRITLAEHSKWFQRKLKDPDTFLYIVEDINNLIGQVRFDKKGGSDIFAIDYSIAPDYRGMGIGTKMLDLAANELTKDVLHPFKLNAEVKKSNLPSVKIFRNLNFISSSNDDTIIYFSKNYD